MYSHWEAKESIAGRQAGVLSHTATPRQTMPPAWSASVVAGSWRQSVNRTTGAPGTSTRFDAMSQIPIHAMNERWSRLSPSKSGRAPRASLRVYLSSVEPVRSPRNAPPLLYGGSVIRASKGSPSYSVSQRSASAR